MVQSLVSCLMFHLQPGHLQAILGFKGLGSSISRKKRDREERRQGPGGSAPYDAGCLLPWALFHFRLQ